MSAGDGGGLVDLHMHIHAARDGLFSRRFDRVHRFGEGVNHHDAPGPREHQPTAFQNQRDRLKLVDSLVRGRVPQVSKLCGDLLGRLQVGVLQVAEEFLHGHRPTEPRFTLDHDHRPLAAQGGDGLVDVRRGLSQRLPDAVRP